MMPFWVDDRWMRLRCLTCLLGFESLDKYAVSHPPHSSHSPPPTSTRSFPWPFRPRWPTTTSSANSLQSSILHTDMLYGGQVQRIRISPCKLAMSVSFTKANSIVFSMPCFQQTIHPTSEACRNIMNPLSPTCRTISTRTLLIAMITVRLGSG